MPRRRQNMVQSGKAVQPCPLEFLILGRNVSSGMVATCTVIYTRPGATPLAQIPLAASKEGNIGTFGHSSRLN